MRKSTIWSTQIISHQYSGQKNWAEVVDDARENKQVRSKTLMLDSSFCDDSDAYILVKGTTAITGLGSPI